MEYRTTRYKYTYTRKTRDRYQIFARPKFTKQEWELILDTYDCREFTIYHDSICYPMTAKTETKYTARTHSFKFSTFREPITEDKTK
jgi:hypothetical protein